MTTIGVYTATAESLNAHPVPAWFEDAKFGIFTHWGLFSVPGFAPKGTLEEVLRTNYGRLMTASPYAEDYGNAMRDPDSPTARHHRERYGDMPYQAFKPMFEAELRGWDPAGWARTFRDAGARYVVITAKYHDGFSLWPTGVRHPREPGWHLGRDVIGELATAVRGQGLKFGVYYSGGVDWTFQREVMHTLGDYSYMGYGKGYDDYAEAQVRELIDRYRPDILWNDIGWPTGEKRLHCLFADYYNTVPDGVVNDRWSANSFRRTLMATRPARALFDWFMKLAITHDPGVLANVKPPVVPHCDYTTPEYTQYDTRQARKWETDRGIGNSFGYNQNELDTDYASFVETLGPELIAAVSKNGNLLLNVGPRGGSGTIVEPQLSRLRDFGRWLATNGEAVYGTRPWRTASARATDGSEVFFTQKDGDLYVLPLSRPEDPRVEVQGVVLAGVGTTVGGVPVEVRSRGANTVLGCPRLPDEPWCPPIRIEGAARSSSGGS
jgi:alpha-L-fucosidase